MHRFLPVLLLALAGSIHSQFSTASDGQPDFGNRYPAVAGYYEYFVYLFPGQDPEVAYAEQSCSGSLISEKVILTAAHCTAFNYTEDIGVEGYYDEVWVTFNLTATANDFRCFLTAQGVPYVQFMSGDMACDEFQLSDPFPVFHKAAVTGRKNGIPIAHGLTHPAYLRPELKNDGTAQRATPNLQNASDVGALLLEKPITAIEPLPLVSLGTLDTLPDLVGAPASSVGYGLNWSKLSGQKPSPSLGPMSDLGGGNGVKRIA